MSSASGGGPGIITVSASDPACTWTASSDASWLATGTPTYGYPGRVLADGAVGYWRLDESSGTSVADASGHGHVGFPTSSVAWQQAGAIAGGTAAAFDAVNPGITLPPSFTNLSTALTAEAWVRTTSASGWQTLVVSQTSSHAEAWGLYLNAGVPAFELQTPAGSESGLAGLASIADGQWHYVAGTWDGTTAQLYVDGVLNRTASFPAPLTTDGPIGIGHYPSWSVMRLAGALDDVAIYDQALNGDQIAQHYALGLASATSAGSGVVTYAVGANLTSAARMATLTLDDASVVVTQAAAASCSTAVSPSNIASGPGGATGSIVVAESDPSCAWTATSDASWVAVNGATYGYAVRVLTDGAAGYWRLNEATGDSVSDASGHGLTGVATAPVTWQQAGAIAGDAAAAFDGDGSGITVLQSSIDSTAGLTAEAWVKTTSATSWQTLVDHGVFGDETWGLFLGSGVPYLEVQSASGAGGSLWALAPITDGLWHHVAGTWDNATLRLYVDDVLHATQPLVGPVLANDGPIGIAQYPTWNGGLRLAGSLDEVAIYGRALTAAEIAAHSALGRAAATATGSAVLNYVVAANSGASARTATVTIGYQSVTMTQTGSASCTTAVSPTSISIGSTGATGSIIVAENDPSCAWAATSDVSWVTLNAPTHGYGGRVLADGAAGYWRLNETSGGIAADASGHGLTGIATAPMNWQQPGAIAGGAAASFDGNNGGITVPSPTVRFATGVTAEAWVKTTSANSWQMLLGHGIFADETWGLFLGSGVPYFEAQNASGGSGSLWALMPIADGQWHHIVATWDGMKVRLYVDSVLQATQPFTGPLLTTDGPLGVAHYPSPDGGARLDGSLDDVAIYGRALTAAEVASHFALGRAGVTTTGSAVVTYVVSASSGASARTATLSIGGQSVAVTQAAFVVPTCTATVTPSSVVSAASGLTGTIAVTESDPSCAWTATSDASWATVASTTYGYPGQVLADGAAGYWRLDETSGTSVADASGHGLTGTATAPMNWQQAGAIAGDTAAAFDGNSGGITVPSPTVQFGTGLTAEAWVKTTSTNSWQVLVDHGMFADETWSLWLGSGVPYFEAQNASGGGGSMWALAPIIDGQWHHIVVTFDGAKLRLYVDAILHTMQDFAGPLLATDGPLGIGHYPDPNGGARLDGSLDEVAIYGRALSSAEIAQHYALRFSTGASGPGLVSFVVAPNTLASARAATLTLGGTAISVTQAAAPGCSYTVTPTTLTATAAGGSSDITVTTATGCAWTTGSNGSWVAVTTGSSGSGSATYTVAANTTTSSRTATLTVAGQAITVTQAGVVVPTVSVAVSSPFQGTTFNRPTSITLAATATVTNGSVTRIDFFAGTILIGSATASPFQVAWSSPTAGTYALTASALDNTGNATISVPVSVTVNASGSGSGTLGAPIATLASGIYGPGQTVTLTAAPGAEIRYTLDQSPPWSGANLYTGPITLAASALLRASAFEAGWASSAELIGNYTIDAAPPVITPVFDPPPNAAGWNNTPVTVSFVCTDVSGVSACPQPILFSNQGAGQTVNVTATDLLSNQASLTVTVNIDQLPSTAVLSGTADGASTIAESITITGQISDSMSGPGSVTCNGIPATVVAGAVECTVSLTPGLNAVVLQATNGAGNSTSSGVRVTRHVAPTWLSVAPSTQAILLGETRSILAVADSGPVAAGVSWTSSDSSVVSLDGNGLLTGEGVGVATVTATVGNLSAVATIIVGVSAVEGSTRWSIAPTPGLYPAGPSIYANRIDDSGPDLFSVETPDFSGLTSSVRALRADGVELWTHTVPGTPLFGDVFGSLVSLVYAPDYQHSGLLRISASDGSRPWQYESAGYVGLTAQAPDGTIYLVDQVGDANFVVGLDGQSGQSKFRIPLPGSSWTFTLGGNCPDGFGPTGFRPTHHTSGSAGPISIGVDGAAYFELANYQDAWAPICSGVWAPNTDNRQLDFDGGWRPGEGTFAKSRTLHLMRVDAAGTMSTQTLFQLSDQGPDANPGTSGQGFFAPDAGMAWAGPELVVPDGVGGLLASWIHTNPGPSGWEYESRITRIAGGAIAEHTVPMPSDAASSGASPVVLVGQDGTAYLQVYDANWMSHLTAVDVSTWTTKWTMNTGAVPVMTLNDGGVAIHDSTAGILSVVSSTGIVASTSVMPLTSPSSSLAFGRWEGVDPSTGSPTSSFGPALSPGAFSFLGYAGGNQQRQMAPPPTFKTADQAAIAAMNYVFPRTWETRVEIGGRICQSGPGSYNWTGPVSEGNASQVNVSLFPVADCKANTTAVGNYHTHPESGDPYPSGTFVGTALPNDINTANLQPDVTFYAMTRPLLSTDLHAVCPVVGCVPTMTLPAPARSIYRYKGTNLVPNPFDAINHLFQKLPSSMGDPYQNGGWVFFPRQ